MRWKPDILALDFETECSGGSALEFYRHDFRVKSASVSWFKRDGSIGSRFLAGEKKIEIFLASQVKDTPLVVHNAQFELGVILCRYPNLKPNVAIDTTRLAQNADGGGSGKNEGYSLVKCIKRWLPSEYHDHKQPFIDYLVEKYHCKPKEAGGLLDRLPLPMLEEYNNLDTELTLRLYKQLTDYFEAIGFDWRLDHQLYMSSCRLLAKSKARGVLVNRPQLADEIVNIEQSLINSDSEFRERFKAQIETIEGNRVNQWLGELKSESGREKRKQALKSDTPGVMEKNKLAFNVNSTSQKEELFVKHLGITPTFKTPKDAPSFKDTHLKSYGVGGEMLAGRGNLKFVKSQAENLLELTEYDSRWHLDMKATGSRTSRMAGGREE